MHNSFSKIRVVIDLNCIRKKRKNINNFSFFSLCFFQKKFLESKIVVVVTFQFQTCCCYLLVVVVDLFSQKKYSLSLSLSIFRRLIFFIVPLTLTHRTVSWVFVGTRHEESFFFWFSESKLVSSMIQLADLFFFLIQLLMRSWEVVILVIRLQACTCERLKMIVSSGWNEKLTTSYLKD
jgi:hypothetical protein